MLWNKLRKKWECRKWTEYGILFHGASFQRKGKTVSGKTAAQATVQPQKDRKDEAIFNKRNLYKMPIKETLSSTPYN